jgi:hypothetical protein
LFKVPIVGVKACRFSKLEETSERRDDKIKTFENKKNIAIKNFKYAN